MIDITPAMNHEFRMAKRLRCGMLGVQGLIAVGSLVAVGKTERWLSVFGICVVLAACVSLWMKHLSNEKFQCAERYRRILFYSKSLDEAIPSHEIGIIFADYADADRQSNLAQDEYYDSEAIPGSRRMLENLQESSFYTRKLARSSLIAFRATVIIGLAVATLYLLFAVVGPAVNVTEGNLRRAAEISTKLIAFAVLGSYFDLWASFASLASASDRIFRDVSLALARDGDMSKEALKLVSAYDCALTASSPIPTPIWMKDRKALDKGWSAIKATRHGDARQQLVESE